MAIDTRAKRFSMLNFGDGVIQHSLPQADGTIDEGDRLMLLGLYSGLGASNISALQFTNETLTKPSFSGETLNKPSFSNETLLKPSFSGESLTGGNG